MHDFIAKWLDELLKGHEHNHNILYSAEGRNGSSRFMYDGVTYRTLLWPRFHIPDADRQQVQESLPVFMAAAMPYSSSDRDPRTLVIQDGTSRCYVPDRVQFRALPNLRHTTKEAAFSALNEALLRVVPNARVISTRQEDLVFEWIFEYEAFSAHLPSSPLYYINQKSLAEMMFNNVSVDKWTDFEVVGRYLKARLYYGYQMELFAKERQTFFQAELDSHPAGKLAYNFWAQDFVSRVAAPVSTTFAAAAYIAEHLRTHFDFDYKEESLETLITENPSRYQHLMQKANEWVTSQLTAYSTTVSLEKIIPGVDSLNSEPNRQYIPCDDVDTFRQLLHKTYTAAKGALHLEDGGIVLPATPKDDSGLNPQLEVSELIYQVTFNRDVSYNDQFGPFMSGCAIRLPLSTYWDICQQINTFECNDIADVLVLGKTIDDTHIFVYLCVYLEISESSALQHCTNTLDNINHIDQEVVHVAASRHMSPACTAALADWGNRQYTTWYASQQCKDMLDPFALK